MERRVFYRNTHRKVGVFLAIWALAMIALIPFNLTNPTVDSLYGMIATLLLLSGWTFLSKRLWPVAVTSKGVEARNFFGQSRFIAWEDIDQCRSFQQVVHYWSKLNPKKWITTTLRLEDLAGFKQALIELSPPDNPAHQWALSHGGTLDPRG
ncbi:MAG: PH domain-containing protein [Chthonomonas sp.]|nr:PH domain-containing protein [Chthonomonas sp.]